MWLEKSFTAIFFNPTQAWFNCLLAANDLKAATDCVLADSYSLSFSVMIGISLYCYIASLVTKNDSWVDRLWSIIPIVHGWIFALYKPKNHSMIPKDIAKIVGEASPLGKDFPLTGPMILASCITVWGLRLTYNFWRRGGYSKGGEDYRWEHVRTMGLLKNPVVWQLFSFGFISFFQMLLLWLITVPISLVPHQAPTSVELFVASVYLVLVAFEATADQQQWVFQSAKYNERPRDPKRADEYKRGFGYRGLFARSRHPNVWAEQQIWICLFGVSFVYSGGLNASGLGAVILVLLTIRSTILTEELSLKKYPEYAAYQKAVPMLVPAFFNPYKKLEEEFEKFAKRRADKNK